MRRAVGNLRLVRYADEIVVPGRMEQQAREAWKRLQEQFAALGLVVRFISDFRRGHTA